MPRDQTGRNARLREIPFIPYTEPLMQHRWYLTLIGQYVDTTGDIAYRAKVWDNIERPSISSAANQKMVTCRYGYGKGARFDQHRLEDSGDSRHV